MTFSFSIFSVGLYQLSLYYFSEIIYHLVFNNSENNFHLTISTFVFLFYRPTLSKWWTIGKLQDTSTRWPTYINIENKNRHETWMKIACHLSHQTITNNNKSCVPNDIQRIYLMRLSCALFLFRCVPSHLIQNVCFKIALVK